MKNTKNKPIVFQAKNGAIQLKADVSKETIWATQAQIAEVFEVTPQNITLHLKNIYKDKELLESLTCKEFLQVQNEGGRVITRKVKNYNLDVIISVGYRVNSKKATNFRIWATKTLNEYITKGFAINKVIVARHYDVFMKAVDDIKKLLPEGNVFDAGSALELVKLFSGTWLSLGAYDQQKFPKSGATLKQARFTGEELQKAVFILKSDLMVLNDANDNFATERSRNALVGIVGNVLQSFGGKDVYPSLEEKAAHLLYFVVKNHPFIDGNKRTGAFAFVWFLNKVKILDTKKMTPIALTALTLLVAESDPKEKEKMIGLILLLLKN